MAVTALEVSGRQEIEATGLPIAAASCGAPWGEAAQLGRASGGVPEPRRIVNRFGSRLRLSRKEALRSVPAVPMMDGGKSLAGTRNGEGTRSDGCPGEELR
jgi:hypothetical protein